MTHRNAGRGGITPREGRSQMARKTVVSCGIDGHTERKVLTRSFETLEAAQKFAEGRFVHDIYKRNGRFAVEYEKTTRVVYDKDGFPAKRFDVGI